MATEGKLIPVPCMCGLKNVWRDTMAQAADACHHTPPEKARDLQLLINSMMDEFAHQIPIDQFFSKPLQDLAQEYANMVVVPRGPAGADPGTAPAPDNLLPALRHPGRSVSPDVPHRRRIAAHGHGGRDRGHGPAGSRRPRSGSKNMTTTSNENTATPEMTEINGIEQISQRIRECRNCPLHQGVQAPVPGDGPADARIMFIGEAPGAEEDRLGRPFTGPSGKLLDSLLTTALLNRSQVYVTNVLKCRPPDNADPLPEQIEACRSHLDAEIEAVSPDVIIPLGACSTARFFPGVKTGTVRGKAIERDGLVIMPMFHPAAALRRKEWTRNLVEDFMKVADHLEGNLQTEVLEERTEKTEQEKQGMAPLL